MSDDTKVKVTRTTRATRTVRMFWYGGIWRVQYTAVTNSKKDSRLIQAINEEYPTKPEAEKAYNQIVNIMIYRMDVS